MAMNNKPQMKNAGKRKTAIVDQEVPIVCATCKTPGTCQSQGRCRLTGQKLDTI